jgi:DNA processing protein
MDIRILSPQDLLGPLNEVEAKHAPKTLYVAGDTSILEQGARVSIVGSRKASPEGIRRASRLASILVKRGAVVVSGLAEGIDTAAHKSAIEHGGRTIAVLGTPLDQFYPRQNADLQRLIMAEHLAISQYPQGYPVRGANFPLRNRLMALISDATVIIEANDTSGSLHQGWEALRLGRSLFIAKSITENTSVTWPAKMSHYGARILADDRLDEFFDLLPTRVVDEFDCEIPF